MVHIGINKYLRMNNNVFNQVGEDLLYRMRKSYTQSNKPEKLSRVRESPNCYHYRVQVQGYFGR